MKTILPLLLACLFAAFPASAPAFALDLGDKAIALTVGQWVTGSEEVDPTVVDGEHFYLVEVWSVTCPPCVESIPMLNDIQRRYGDKGLKIASFTTDALEDVTPFLQEHPIEYASFLDKEGGTMVNYMAADNRNTIPHAFLFDKTGVLVWTGNPLDSVEARIEDVLSGKLNGERALSIKKARSDFEAAMGGQDIESMLSALKELESLEPENSQYFAAHYGILTEFGAGDASDVKALFGAWYAASRGNPVGLMQLSMFAMEQGMPEMREPALALAAAREAYALGGVTKLQSGLTLAEIYKSAGRIDLSKSILSEMLGAVVIEEQRTALQSILDYFTKLETIGQTPDAPYAP